MPFSDEDRMTGAQNVDFLIVGSGFSGLVSAERLSAAGYRCAVIDKRSHIGGNAYDCHDEAGVLIHPYGPHYFRSNSARIVSYLSRFTEWHEVAYKVKSYTRGRFWSFPINLNTFEEWLGREATELEWRDYLDHHKVEIEHPQNSEEVIISQVGWEFYRIFFEPYTLKQWKRHPRELQASVCGRVPIRLNRDNRYLTESFQAMPTEGFTAMFEKMIASSPGLQIRLGIDFEEEKTKWTFKHLIFTGPIDEYYGHCFGSLPYRSLRFERETYRGEELAAREAVSGKAGYWQPEMQVNYPDLDVPYTRTVEIKHATGQRIDSTTVLREFPEDWGPGKEPFYPVPTDASAQLYARYKRLAESETNVSFIGRLGTYRYYNMDQVTGMALTEAEKLIQRYRPAEQPTL
jgi:UDP-galactopyranose mutase